MSICLCLTCLFGTAGFGAGYHFSLLALNVDKEYRGRVFAIGYGLGSVGTYLLILLPSDYYTSILSLTLYIPIILLNLFLVLKYTVLEELKKEKYSKSFKSSFIKISIIVLSMSLLSALSTDAISVHTINISGGYGGTRLYYCIGLLIAGFLVDKNKNVFDNLTIVSFIFSLLAIILLKDNYSINLIAALSYFFIGFFVLFRTISFIDLTDTKRSIVFASAFGLMYSRIMEGILTLVENRLLKNYTALIITISISLAILIFLFLLLYFQTQKLTESDMIKALSIKYKLTNQEEKVLNYLIQGKSNQEIADSLYISLYTVKRHVANIYKKTNMNKKELIEKCYLGLK
ncbi:MAG: helix-turn-helix transcriptional regulator [Bacilli bacterium]|nr:helix-turn-helix transcriptional regulator [Bacilli bacterium]